MKAILELGVPHALAKELYRKVDLSHKVIPKPLDKAPRSKNEFRGGVVLRKTKNHWYAMVMAGGGWRQNERWAVYNEDGEERVTCQYTTARQYFGKGASEYYTVGFLRDVWRPTEYKDPTEPEPWTPYEVIEYANQVFLPTIRKRFSPIVDAMYNNIRLIPKHYDTTGKPKLGTIHSPARVKTLKLAEDLEDLLESGYTHSTINQWLANMNAYRSGWGSDLANKRAFAAAIMEPNATARIGKVLVNQAAEIQERYEEMNNAIANHMAENTKTVDFPWERVL